MKKAKKAYPLLHIFKRGGRDGVSDRRRDDKTNNNTGTAPGKLFGHPLSSVCDSDNNPPKTVVVSGSVPASVCVWVGGCMRACMRVCMCVYVCVWSVS